MPLGWDLDDGATLKLPKMEDFDRQLYNRRKIQRHVSASWTSEGNTVHEVLGRKLLEDPDANGTKIEKEYYLQYQAQLARAWADFRESGTLPVGFEPEELYDTSSVRDLRSNVTLMSNEVLADAFGKIQMAAHDENWLPDEESTGAFVETPTKWWDKRSSDVWIDDLGAAGPPEPGTRAGQYYAVTILADGGDNAAPGVVIPETHLSLGQANAMGFATVINSPATQQADDAAEALDANQGPPDIKKAAVHKILKYFDKAGQDDPRLIASPENGLYKHAYINMREGQGVHWEEGQNGGAVAYKVIIPRVFIDAIPRLNYPVRQFGTYFTGFFDGYLEIEYRPTDLLMELSEWENGMRQYQQELDKWIADGSGVEPAEWSFLEEIESFNKLIGLGGKGALNELLNLNHSWPSFPCNLTRLAGDPHGKLVVMYDDLYDLQDMYVLATDRRGDALTGMFSPSRKMPINIRFDFYK